MRLSRLTRQVVVASVAVLSLVACGKDSPTNPSPQPQPQPQPNRTIELGGPLDFGNVQIGQTVERELRINNRGTSTLTVTSFNGPSGYTASWTSGTVAAGAVQVSIVRFTPTEARSYSGTLTVVADHTAGNNQIAINAAGVRPPRPRFGLTGVGNTVFDLPKDAARLRIIGNYSGNSSNFIVRIAGRLVVNELLGTGWSQTRYQGDHLVPSQCAAAAGATCVVEIVDSTGVAWSFEELVQ